MKRQRASANDGTEPRGGARRRLPHAAALLLVIATFPLLWVGGLVTTTDAGMAVPDWPTTYGYNLFLYPWQSWLTGPWDLFIEHGHRLLGALVGILTIVLVVACWKWDERRWVRVLSVMALLLVIGQGLLGGARVVWDARLVALVHGCVGPLFLLVAVTLVVVTSSWWRGRPADAGSAHRIHRHAVLLTGMAYLQLVFGAGLRHMPAGGSAQLFAVLVWLHLIGALFVLGAGSGLGIRCWREGTMRTASICLALLIAGQLALGGASWVVKYGWPVWFESWPTAAGFTIEAAGMAQSLIVTGHVANGSLILGLAWWMSMRSGRRFAAAPSPAIAAATAGSAAS